MKEYRSGQPANEVHTALKSALQAMEEAKHSSVLRFGEILDRKLFKELGYSSINQYAEVALGFSTSRTGDYLMLCRKLKDLPKLKDKVESGDLGYTTARVLAPIIDKTNEAGWVDFALNNPRREVEREVKRARKEAADKAAGQPPLLAEPSKRPAAIVPVMTKMEMSPTQFARYEKLWEQIRKQGGVPADKVEALLAIMESFTTQSSPRGDIRPPAQIHIHKCPECEQATVPTSKGELKLSAAELEQAQCDCQVSSPGQRNTTSITPATRREVLACYRHKCQRPGCRHTGYLQVHHVVPRCAGGSNNPQNLTCVCSACHKLLHDQNAGKFGILAKEPSPVYRLSGPYPIRHKKQHDRISPAVP